MPKTQYNLENGLGTLEVSWNAFQTQYQVKLDNQLLAEISAKDLKKGKEFILPNSSVLKVKLAMVFLNYEVRIFINNKPLGGSPSDPRYSINQAVAIAYLVGGLGFILGLMAELSQSIFLLGIGFGYSSVVEGGIFIVFGYYISKNKSWAALAAGILLTLDTVLYIIFAANTEGVSGGSIVGPLFVKIYFITYLFKGYKATKELNSQTAVPKNI